MFEHRSQPPHLHYQYVLLASPKSLKNGRGLHLERSQLSAESFEPLVARCTASRVDASSPRVYRHRLVDLDQQIFNTSIKEQEKGIANNC
jgi:hypothetical protein